jgi:hypothetical protein
MRNHKKFEEFIKKDDAIDILCAHLANGGNIIEFCEMHEIPFCQLTTWASKPENIDQYKMAIFSQTEWAVQKILNELKTMTYADRAAVFYDDGTLKPVTEWPKNIRSAVAGIDVKFLDDGTQVNKIKFESKTKTLEMMMKNLGILTDRAMSLHLVGSDEKFIDEFFGMKKQENKTGEEDK